jgi:GAF domain-containing protein
VPGATAASPGRRHAAAVPLTLQWKTRLPIEIGAPSVARNEVCFSAVFQVHVSNSLRDPRADGPPFPREGARHDLLPGCFEPAAAVPGLVDALHDFGTSAYAGSTLPETFKDRLFVHLSRFGAMRPRLAQHLGILLEQRRSGNQAAEATLVQAVELLRREMPGEIALADAFWRLEHARESAEWPSPRSQREYDLFDALSVMFHLPQESRRARAAVRHAVGEATFERLVACLAFIRTAHYWAEMHPDAIAEPDNVEALREYPELAEVPHGAELAPGSSGPPADDAVGRIERAVVALRERDSRHAFLLALSDTVRLLADPRDIQDAACRLLAERLPADRVCFAEIDEAHGRISLAGDIACHGAPRLAGHYPLSTLAWTVPALRTGPVVVDDAAAARVFPEAARSVAAELGVAALVAAPIVREGRLVAVLCAATRSPRTWRPADVALVAETAERTYTAAERALGEQALRANEERMRLALTAAGIGSFVWNVAEHRGEPDPEMLSLFNTPPGEGVDLAATIARRIHPDDRARYLAAIVRASDPAGSGALHEEIRVVRPDGTVRRLLVKGRARFEGTPLRPLSMAGVAIDVTDRTRR